MESYQPRREKTYGDRRRQGESSCVSLEPKNAFNSLYQDNLAVLEDDGTGVQNIVFESKRHRRYSQANHGSRSGMFR